jgi:RNA polymerase sigma factor (sigma-70 family)
MTDYEGFKVIFLANRSMLARFLRARLGGHTDCEDVMQDLWLKLGTLDAGPITEPLPYLFRMAENLARDRLRSESRRKNRDNDWAKVQIGGGNSNANDGQPSAERVLIAREQLRRIEDVLDKLPERTAFIFRTVRIDGTPQKQVAAEMGVSVSAVEKHLQKAYRAVLNLHHVIDAENAEPQRLYTEGIHDAGE